VHSLGAANGCLVACMTRAGLSYYVMYSKVQYVHSVIYCSHCDLRTGQFYDDGIVVRLVRCETIMEICV
jgi:hypothetical protein